MAQKPSYRGSNTPGPARVNTNISFGRHMQLDRLNWHYPTLMFSRPPPLLADRKRMSVVVEDAQGRIMLLCKGADSTVLGQCIEGDKERTVEHVNYYAMVSTGLAESVSG